jgi:site-specific recombinase XerD
MRTPGHTTQFVYHDPKSKAGIRGARLTELAREALHRHRAQQEADQARFGWQNVLDLVFLNPEGKQLYRGTVGHRWKDALRAAGLPATLRFHDLRHGMATLMAAEGVHPKVIAAALGHGSTRQTERYTQVLSGMERDAWQRVATLLSPADAPATGGPKPFRQRSGTARPARQPKRPPLPGDA